jgi:hypothetical protein
MNEEVPWVLAAKTGKVGFANRLGRGDRSPLGVWFWELDRVLLALMLVLIAIGLLAVAAASPAGAQRLSSTQSHLPALYFFYRQLMWVIIAVPLMLVVSMYPREQARRFAVVGFLVAFTLLALVPMLGNEVNGSQRWVGPGPARVQPSEFLKPFFAVSMGYQLAPERSDIARAADYSGRDGDCLHVLDGPARPWPDDPDIGHLVCIDDGIGRSGFAFMGIDHRRRAGPYPCL